MLNKVLYLCPETYEPLWAVFHLAKCSDARFDVITQRVINILPVAILIEFNTHDTSIFEPFPTRSTTRTPVKSMPSEKDNKEQLNSEQVVRIVDSLV